MPLSEETKAEIGRLRLQEKDILVCRSRYLDGRNYESLQRMLDDLGLKNIGMIFLTPEDEIGILRLETPIDAFDDPEG